MKKVPEQTDAIVIERLSKRYPGSEKMALNNVSLAVRSGEVYGFLGPNGAGKSTTIRILLNFIQPTLGGAQILGKDAVHDSVAIKQSVGYLAGDFAVYPKMSASQYLSYLGSLAGKYDGQYVKELAKRLQADLNMPLGEMSRGNRQKIGVIQAFMQHPEVLILDEPTTGLDPLMQEVFYDLLMQEKSRGTAVFMSSHILGEVQKTCDRVGIIKNGRLVSEQNIADLSAEAAQTFDITFKGHVPLAELKKVPGLTIAEHHKQNVTIHMQGALGPLFMVLAHADVQKIGARALDLEELFLGLYQDTEAKK